LNNAIAANIAADLLRRLNEERAALHAFVVLLEKEQEVLLSSDIDPLLTFAEHKTQSAHKLAEMGVSRRQLMTPNPNKLDTSAWIKQYAPSCSTIWDEIRELAARAHHLNHTNGEVIQLKLRSNQQALNALLGAAQNTTALYGRDGQPSVPISGRTLGSG
jgi:flagella synthesis protein FlgN